MLGERKLKKKKGSGIENKYNNSLLHTKTYQSDQSDDTVLCILKNELLESFGWHRKLLIIGDQMKTMTAEGIEELVWREKV